MSGLVHIGSTPWSRQEIIASIDDFCELYANRPIKNNSGGMKAPHMFAVWFIARKIQPDVVVESGIWKGQSTWLLEQACPDSRLISIDLDLGVREYISRTATYTDRDFCELDWSSITDRSLVFFDDHQNAYTRLQQCKWFGFRNIIFEDNYPPGRGDCYSLKKVLAHAGYEPVRPQKKAKRSGLAHKISGKLLKIVGIDSDAARRQCFRANVAPNDVDSRFLHKHLEVYDEFPPVIKTATTRWGDEWTESNYPTPPPLLHEVEKPAHQVFLDEALSYTWICYVRLE